MSIFSVPCVTVQTVEKHPNADSLDIITFNEIGWTCIDKLGKRSIGEKVVYVPVDSLVPVNRPEFEFLVKDARLNGMARIKTIKLRQIFSQGLIVDAPENAEVGEDYADHFGIIKYEPPEEGQMNSPRGGKNWPAWAEKSDAERYQNVIRILEPLKDMKWYATMKMDGTSASYMIDFLEDEENQRIICSRNLDITKNETSFYHEVEKKYNIFGRMLVNFKYCTTNMLYESINGILDDYGKIEKLVLQGEICGPGIQKNRMGLTEKKFYAFDIYIVSEKYVGFIDYDKFIRFLWMCDIETVPRLFIDKLPSLEEGLKISNELKYPNDHPAEGVVYVACPTINNIRGLGRAKVKILSQVYDLKINKD